MKRTETPFKKQCPVCGCDQYYRNKYDLKDSIKKNKICRKCVKLTEQFINTKKQTCIDKYGVESYSQTEEYKEKIKQTNLKRYGVSYYSQTKESKEIIKQMHLEKYGVEYYLQTSECKEKIKQTNLQKYGVENVLSSKQIQQKSKQTNLKKYGVENVLSSKQIQQKSKQTMVEKYGVENPSQSNEIKEKIKTISLERYGVEHVLSSKQIQQKSKQTNLQKYGVEYPIQNIKIKEKIQQTNLEKYGVDNYTRTEEYKIKMLSLDIMWTNEQLFEYIQTHYNEYQIIKTERIEGKIWQFTDIEFGDWIIILHSSINSIYPHPIRQFLNKLKNININFTCKVINDNLYEITNLDLNSIPFITNQLKQDYKFKQHFFSEEVIPDLLQKLTYNYPSAEYTFNTQEITNKYSCEFKTLIEYINYKFVEYYQHPLIQCSEEEYKSLQLDHSIPQSFFKKYFPQNWENLANHYTNVKYIKNLNKENQKKSDKYFFNLEKVLQWYREGNVVFPEHLYDFEKENQILKL